MRALVFVPEPGFPEAHEWAFDVEAEALRADGFEVVARAWSSDEAFDDFDVVLPLVAWGYQLDPARWMQIIERLEREARCVVNPPEVLRWNTDKSYLVALGERGVPTIPTRRIASLDEDALAPVRAEFGDDLVVKPPISGGAYGTHRLRSGDAIPASEAGREMLAQPFFPAVQSEGEYSLMFFAGGYSHAIIKRARPGEYRVQPHLGGTETACDAPAGSREVAEAALAAAPAACAYARVDLLRGPDGRFRVIELELIEPSLWLNLAPGAPAAFAAAVRAAARE